MRTTAVPAQVTTVEDRIMGNLSFSQMILITGPLFFSAALFAVLPPFMSSSPYKYVTSGILLFLGGVLAIRVKGKILALWMITILRYNLRPKYYLFNKNSSALRDMYISKKEPIEDEVKSTAPVRTTPLVPRLNVAETVRTLSAIDNPTAKLRFETSKKGGLYVRLTKVEEQS